MTILGKLGDNTYQNCNVDHLVYHQTFLDIRMATYLCCWTPTAISRWSCHLGDNFYGVIGCRLAFCTDWAFLPFNLGSFAFSTVGKLGDVGGFKMSPILTVTQKPINVTSEDDLRIAL